MHWWVAGAFFNTIILVAYLAISYSIARGLHRSKQWRSNPLAVATAAIFFTCAVHHGSHPVHMVLPAFGLEEHTGLPMREAFDDWHSSGWDIITAAVAVYYWTLRGRFPALVRGPAVFEDLRERQRQALDIHDNVVQGLAAAKLNFELDRGDEGMRALDDTLAASRSIITDLLGDERYGLGLSPGDLRRQTPAPER
jgi:signal transduction histidine kinase